MITDSQNTLSASQAVTATAVSTNTIDLSQLRDVGVGKDVYIYVNVEVAAAAAGAATVNFQLISSASASLSSPTVLVQTDAIPKASLPVGQQIVLQVPEAILNDIGQRYLGLQYTVGTGPLTAGTFSAGVTLDTALVGRNKKLIYPSGFAVK